MVAVKINTHVSELVFDAVKQMVLAHKFEYDEDMSETQTGKKKKKFKMRLATVENTNRSNLQALRLLGTFEIQLFHNAEGATQDAHFRALRDTEEIIFELERFAPTGDRLENVRRDYIQTTRLANWQTEPVDAGSDHVLRTTIQYEIGYKVSNPNI